MSRFPELDSLRGLAACSVVLHHAMLVFPATTDDLIAGGWSDSGVRLVYTNSPLHVFWAGHQAVMLFFVLSGFVLALPFCRQGYSTPYRVFLTKRFCRIYLPFLAAVLFALFARFLTTPNAHASRWFNAIWAGELGPGDLLSHLTLVLRFDDFQSDPVLWSLTQEMRLSLIFPAIMLLVLKCRWQFVVPGAMLVSFIAFTASGLLRDPQSLCNTVMYSMLFVVGAVLAKHHTQLVDACARMRASRQWLSLGTAVCLYTSSFWLLAAWPWFQGGFLELCLTTAGSGMFVVMSLSVPGIRRIVRSRIALFLGRISYSLYLVHTVVIVVAVHTLADHLPLALILALATVGSVAVAALSFRFVESPSIEFGRRLTAPRLTSTALHT